MINKLTITSLMLFILSSFTFAEGISDDEIKKALEGIKQIEVIERNESKIISEVLITEKVVLKATKSKKKKPKKITKKREVEEDLSNLPIVETLGVIKRSESFELQQ